MTRQYTTGQAVYKLIKNPNLEFVRVGDPDYILFADTKDIRFRVHTYESNFSAILYKYELWELRGEK